MIVFPYIILSTSFWNLYTLFAKKTKTYFLTKTKTFFQTKELAFLARRRVPVSSVKTYLNWWCETPDHGYKLVRNYKSFCFLRCFKLKTGLRIMLYHLSLATCRGEWLLRMIPSACLFRNVHEINQQY